MLPKAIPTTSTAVPEEPYTPDQAHAPSDATEVNMLTEMRAVDSSNVDKDAKVGGIEDADHQAQEAGRNDDLQQEILREPGDPSRQSAATKPSASTTDDVTSAAGSAVKKGQQQQQQQQQKGSGKGAGNKDKDDMDGVGIDVCPPAAIFSLCYGVCIRSKI